MNDIELEKIRKIRSSTGCPIWAIVKCLKLERWCEDEAVKRLEKIYAWYYNIGDHPELTLKQKEKELRDECLQGEHE